MPSASANISAKFIAQIEMSRTCVPRYSEPAEATRPRIVSISGSPAATREPNASSRMPSVTGQEISSDFIIAVLLASLKSDHMPDAPVSESRTPSAGSAASSVLEVVGGAHHLVRARGGARLDDGGAAVARDGLSRPRRDDLGHSRVGLERSLGVGDDGLEGRVGGGLLVGVHDDHQRRRGEAAELAVDGLADGERLRAGGLPAGAGEGVLDLGGEDAEADGDDRPSRVGERQLVK